MPSIRHGRLFLVPNLLGTVPPQDVLPARTIEVARGLTHFVAETPKAARSFLKTLAPLHALQAISIEELNDRVPPQRIHALLSPALAGRDMGMLSDAGCPGVADPGALLVAAAHDAGIKIIPLVGPSAVLLALMVSGMNGQAFTFHGYLPVKPDARAKALGSLDDAATRSGSTQLFIETPYRNDAMIEAVLATCRAATRLCVACDLTLPGEQVISRSIARWRSSSRPTFAKRPAMFVLGSG